MDLGLATFATLSDGSEVANPRYFDAARKKLRRAQRRMSRRGRGSGRWRRCVQSVVRLHAHVRNQRSDFHHKQSKELVDSYRLIAIEDLNVKALVRSELGRQISDAGWACFIFKRAYRAESAGRVLVKVDPRGTSQRCVCGARVLKHPWQRRHICAGCGLDAGRDHASAMEILRLGLSLLAVK